MSNIEQRGEWLFEGKSWRALKTPSYGCPFHATVTFEVVNGKFFVTNMLSRKGKGDFTRKDFRVLESYIADLGFYEYGYTRYENGKPRTVHKEIKHNHSKQLKHKA